MRLSIAKTGRIASDDCRQRISVALKGKKRSLESRILQSYFCTGRPKPKGFRPHTARLTEAVVREIKDQLKSMKIKEVHSNFQDKGVTLTQVREISAGRAWKDIKIED